MGLGLALTGFGRFHGIESNPSASVLDAVAEDPVSSVLCVAKEVLETSASGSSERLKEIVQTLAAEQQISAVLLVHLGVNASASGFRIEKCAYNEATFRCPDEQGWMPQEEKICAEYELGMSMDTKVDVEALKISLRSRGFDVEISTDPGRFVCNWTYFNSLLAAHALGKERGIPSSALFVHIPHQDTVPLQVQINFVKALLEDLHKRDTHYLVKC